MTTTKARPKRTKGTWVVKLQGEAIDRVHAGRNPAWTNHPDCMKYKYVVATDDQLNDQIGGRDEIRQCVADMIREIRNDAIETRTDRENDELDEAIEVIKDAGKMRKALDALRAAKLI